MKNTFIEVGHHQVYKNGQNVSGDAFLQEKTDRNQIIVTLSDGLGSGVKANVLATLTATMASKFIAQDIDIKRAAEIIMNTLPVDKVKGISYATFTLVDILSDANVRIMEYDNPPYILIRQENIIEPIKEQSFFERKDKNASPKKPLLLSYSSYQARPGDRLIFFSDGVTQSGMGNKICPFGVGFDAVQDFVLKKIKEKNDISARDLAHSVVEFALSFDGNIAKDDITCGVVYFRKPRDLLIFSGPPLNKEKDSDFAKMFDESNAKKVICGGTTANIISRELKRKVKVELKNIDPTIPPYSNMEGAEIVTEGIITLGKVAEILENEKDFENMKENAATKLVDLFFNSDRITFVVGTKINEAYQDPTMPQELEIRRNVVIRTAKILKEKYLKEVVIQYF